MDMPKAVRIDVGASFGELINLEPPTYGSNQIPPGPLPVDFGVPTQEYLEGDFKKTDNWQQLLVQLKDVPFPDFEEEVDYSLIFRPHVNSNNPHTPFTVVWDIPKKLKNPRAFSLNSAWATAPAVIFDGTADVVLVPHVHQADKWTDEMLLLFTGSYVTGQVYFDGATDETVSLIVHQADKWTTARTLTFTGTDATGSVTFDGSANMAVSLNVLNADYAEAAGTAGYAATAGIANGLSGSAISKDPGNLLQLRPDGIYYGTQSPAQYASMYIDAVNGNDENLGTRAAPLKTIKACLMQGPQGIDRNIYLYNGQQHEIDPADPAILRGGKLVVYPYGPGVDTLPPVPGDAVYNQQAAVDLNTRIQCKPAVNRTTSGNTYQVAEALVLDGNASVVFSAIRFTAPVNNGSGVAFQPGRTGGILGNGNNLVQLVWSDAILPDPLTDLVPESPQTPMTVVWFQALVSGVGKIIRQVNTNFTFTLFASRSNVSGLPSYLGGAQTATKSVYNMNTNLDPNLFP